MTIQTPEPNKLPQEQQEAFFPPQYLLILSVLGFAIALIVAVTQPAFGVVGYGGIAFGVLALVAWVLMAPDQAKGALSGRTARFGGLSVLVTFILIVAMIAIYGVVRNLKVSKDLTQRNDYSLTTAARTAITNLGKDPSLPKMQLIAFYGSGQAGQRDRDTVLFDDYVKTSAGKISYTFIDPDRNPQIIAQYKGTGSTPATAGQIAVAPLNAQGQPDPSKAQIATTASQDQLTNAILKVSASGDFRAYYMNVDGGLTATGGGQQTGMTQLDTTLKQFSWKTQTTTFVDLENPNGTIKLNDASADGEVMIIPGGTKPLSDDELKVLTDYLDKGGNVVLLAGSSLNNKGQSLVSTEKLNTYLWDKFGLRFRNDVVLDTTQAFQTPLLPVATDFDKSSYVTTNIQQGQAAMIFETPHSIEIADKAPADVTVNPLVRTSATSFASTDFASILQGKIAKTDADTVGPFVVAAQATNAKTGAHLVVFGSVSPAQDEFAALQNLDNFPVAFNSVVWSTKFNDFFAATNIVSEQKPQDTPIFADTQTTRNINFLTVFVMPFGILAIGIFVWWNNRERARATR